MPSRIVVFPEPLGPMMPVSPVSKSTDVSACCRKFLRRSWFRRTSGLRAQRRIGDSERLGVRQVLEAQLHQAITIEVRRNFALCQLISHDIHYGLAPARRTLTGARGCLLTANIELEVQCAAFVVTQSA